MNLTRSAGRYKSAGFSLLEMVVALLILALALGTLYRAASGATRNVRIDERYAYGVELASSLLADNGMVPNSGVNISGETSSGFHWYVKTQAVAIGQNSMWKDLLHEIEVGVSWVDGQKQREVVLNSVVEGFNPSSVIR
ncbi:MAG: prepilin-type N-terminal cleavage/methylation domain-containing protein [Halioglobus sp.]